MVSLFVDPGGRLQGNLQIPGDKSITHRALIFSALAQGESSIVKPLASEDTMATVSVLKQLGVTCDCEDPSQWRIRSPGLFDFQAPQKDLHCGNSGTTARIFLGILAAQHFPSRLIGDASLSKRPMERVLTPLKQMGGKFEVDNNFLPLRVLPSPPEGLQAIAYDSPVSSAQVKSACLLAGLYARGLTTFSEPVLSRDHTERLLAASIPVKRTNIKTTEPKKFRHQVQLLGPVKEIQQQHVQVPGDFSTAAFFMVASAILADSKLQLLDVGLNPTRLGLMEILEQMGANLSLSNQADRNGEPVGDLSIESAVLRSANVHGDLVVRCIDELPIWAVAAAKAKGVSVLGDAAELRVKESDRLEALAENLKRLGVSVESKPDGLVIRGNEDPFTHPQSSGYGPGYLESYGDHRIAMAMVVAALGVASGQEPVEIRDTACIATSYPAFAKDLQALLDKPRIKEV